MVKERIRKFCLEAGFDTARFASAETDPRDGDALERFLKAGHQGDMLWMADNRERRIAPRELMDAARTIIVLGNNYGPGTDPLEITRRPERGAISAYAQAGKDYHDIIKKRLKLIGRWIVQEFACDIKVFVDTAPVMEKPLAARAGLGWQGKHSNLVSREFGSWLFLGEIFLTLDLEPDLPEADHCGSCDLCIQACPTEAIPDPYHLDASRCISYLTIEHKGEIAPELMEKMGNHIYGCDDCLAVCPWNKFSTPTTEPGYLPRMELTAPRLKDLAELDDTGFRRVFTASPIKRTGRDRFIRNVLIAIGNSADPSLSGVADALAADPSVLVAKTARWARERLASLDANERPD
jgi:epoxyqueuosine reductase